MIRTCEASLCKQFTLVIMGIRDVFLGGSFIRQSRLRVGGFANNSAIVGGIDRRGQADRPSGLFFVASA